ncbi:PDZ domain-containing protein [Corynebacterium sp. ES2775-CONJ]|uniref:YlbL family protein n=1 Tax=Corynebacterium sp. ES2775-CONJ TaxID=2974029 RepID=UPI0021693616|nr:PDZ domain-containing protein [Corynebacterium sp. ES2775-CONJ]MCS4489453.1 PDZ domain-containing protein [Corynebacterium sp. ES2775-CONJ]
MSRRTRTLAFGAIPVVILMTLAQLDHIPGTNYSLTIPYAAEGQGPTFNTLDEVNGVEVINIDGAEVDSTQGHLDMTTVSVRSNMTLIQGLNRLIVHGDTLIPIEQIFPQGKTEDEIKQLNEAAFSASESAATTAALRYLKRPMDVKIARIVADSAAAEALRDNDVILAIDSVPVRTGGGAQQLVRAKKPGDSIELSIKRGDRRLTKTLTLRAHPYDETVPFLGVNMVTSSAEGISVRYNLEDVGGPSAGMVFALAVIDKLSPGELNHGKYVAGTGTITDTGEVGPIGGIKHKARAAAAAGAELFLAPARNCEELTGENYSSMTVVGVSTLSDAVARMDDFAAGKELISCTDRP